MIIRLGILFFLALSSCLVSADWMKQGMFVKCEDSYSFEISTYNLVSGKPQLAGEYMYSDLSPKDKNRVYWDYEQHKTECDVAGISILAIFQIQKPGSGMCGANPGAKLKLVVDGKDVFGYATVNNDCYDSLNRIKFYSYNGERENLSFTICGHTKDVALHFDGCLEYLNGSFFNLPIPLSAFPLSKLIYDKL